MPDDTPTTPSNRGSGHVDRWVTDTWEGHLHVVLLILESVALSFMITSFVGALDEGPLYRSRFLRLAFRPVVGAGLAVVVYFVLQTGLLSPVSSTPSGAAGVGTVANNATDVYRTLAIACLTGLFARRAMDKLREVFFMLFQPKNQAGQGGQGPTAS